MLLRRKRFCQIEALHTLTQAGVPKESVCRLPAFGAANFGGRLTEIKAGIDAMSLLPKLVVARENKTKL